MSENMSLKEQINEDLKASVKAGDAERRSVLRMLKARILEKEVELRSKKGRDYELNDEEVVDVVTSYAKQRQQSIDAYRQAERGDLAEQEEEEMRVLEPYLPKQLSEEELEAVIRAAIESTGAQSPQDFGKVMRVVMSDVKGKADGKVVNETVRRLLGA